MRTWIILACAVIILSSIVIAEGVIINDFKKDSQMYVKEINNRIESDIVTVDDLECITNAWNKRKDVIYMLIKKKRSVKFDERTSDRRAYASCNDKY